MLQSWSSGGSLARGLQKSRRTDWTCRLALTCCLCGLGNGGLEMLLFSHGSPAQSVPQHDFESLHSAGMPAAGGPQLALPAYTHQCQHIFLTLCMGCLLTSTIWCKQHRVLEVLQLLLEQQSLLCQTTRGARRSATCL